MGGCDIVKILITGGLGFIGKFLTKKLQELGHKVISLDLHIRDYDDYVRADVSDFLDLQKKVKKYGNFDYIIHMAGEVGRIIGEEHPSKMIHINDIGTLNIIHLALEMDAKLMYFSTSEIYGKLFENGEVSEDSVYNLSPFKLTNIYAISKYFGETLINHYVNNYNLKAVGIRPFMVYGPGVIASKYKSAIDRFIFNALTGVPFYVHKNSERAWCYIDDFIDGIILILNNHKFEDKVYEAYNVGTQEYRDMEDVGKIVLKYTDAPSNLMKIINPPNKFIVTKKRFSNKKLQQLSFVQKVSIEEGIKKTVEWHRGVLNDSNNWK